MQTYLKLCSEFYDLDKPEPPPDAFEFYERYARAAAGPILEPMCGSGRYLLPLLAQGLDIQGSDTSTSMLHACRARASAQGLRPTLHQQPLHELEVPRKLGLVFIPSGSFGLIIEQGLVEESLRRVWETLMPGGTFLVEVERLVHGAPEMSGTWGGRWVERPDGTKLVMSWLAQFSGAPNVSRTLQRYELIQEGRLLEVEYEDFQVRSYEANELRRLLEQAGFQQIDVLAPYEARAADDSDEAFVFACRKS